jgi:hypothetical protein
MTAVDVLAASFFSTHHGSAADVLAGRERSVTAPTYPLLVGRSRRFTSLATQMHIEVCGAIAVDGAAPPSTVFATCHGEIQTAETLIADFRATAMVSSARFALSVHNTPSGLYSVATGSMAPSNTITGSNAIAAGWLEAALTAAARCCSASPTSRCLRCSRARASRSGSPPRSCWRRRAPARRDRPGW